MAIPKQESTLLRCLKETSVYDIGVALGSGVVAIIKAEQDKALAVCAGLIFVLSVFKSIVSLREKLKSKSLHELEGCLHTVHSILAGGSKVKLRITIHIPIESDQKLEQILNYVGDSEKTETAGRRFPAQCGVIGEALRTKQTVMARRVESDYEKYIDELVTEWHFTQKDARKLNPATMSWMAIPLEGTTQEIAGVVYLDSSDPDFFSEERQTSAINASVGIARFVRSRYKS
jgi:hypothetical protein